MPTARGWSPGQTPTAAPGLKVNAFAAGLDHPRWIDVLPNGDVLVAEAMSPDRPPRSVFDYAMVTTMRRADAMGISANRITLLRDSDGDGVAETREVFLEGQNQPFGMALVGDTFYVGNTDGVVAFPYTAGASRITAPGRKLVEFKPAGHWTRSLLPSPDGRKLYAGVGSLTNIAENGMAVEEGRAAIYELDLASGSSRIFASGLRNAVGLAWEPQTGALWTVVNERDGLGDETPPDYLTSVQEGGFYGWPYCYWGQTVDDRVPQDAAAVANRRQIVGRCLVAEAVALVDDGPEHVAVRLPGHAHRVAQAAGKDPTFAAGQIELVDRSPSLFDLHAVVGDIGERADASIELRAIGARQQASRPMPGRLEGDELSSLGGDAVRARCIREGHHAVGVADIEGVAHQRHAERLVQSLHENFALFGDAVAIIVAKQRDAVRADAKG
jgi:hypothetical protein